MIELASLVVETEQQRGDVGAGAVVAEAADDAVGGAALLNHVGFTSALAKQDRAALTAQLEALITPPGFTGKAPGGPSRWSTERSSEWQPVRPELVVEVLYDQVSGERFRHGTKLVRRRPDKAPAQCRMEQLDHPLTPAELEQLLG